jgi:putative phosphoesterase
VLRVARPADNGQLGADILGAMTARAARVAAIYDIHGNLPALRAVLAEVDELGADLIVVGGDIASGPLPGETLSTLRARGDVVFIRGNADREVAPGAPEPTDDVVRAFWAWTTRRLDEEQRNWLSELDFSATVEVEGLGEVLFCHGSPRSDEEIITRLSPDERIAPMLKAVAEDIVVCGHTHIQFDRSIGAKRVVNAGSVGIPYEGAPGAYWTVLTDEIEARRTDYDLDEAAQTIEESGFTESKKLIAMLRQPPSSDEASKHFEAMAADASG